jgi:hypothetical protein
MEREALPLDALAIAHAVKNSGGIVIVQVERITAPRTLHPRNVAILDRAFSRFGHRVHVVVNYDNFELLPPAEDAFFAMVRRNTERYFLSSTRYSTNAFYRHLLGEPFTNAQLSQRIYPSIAGVQADLPDRTNSEGPSQAPADQVRQRRPAPGHRCLQPTHVGEYARSR